MELCSVVDPEWFIPDPDPALNFPSSGSRHKFRIHQLKRRIYQLSASPTVHTVQNSQRNNIFIYLFFIFSWIRLRNYNSGSRQKFRIHVDPDPQYWKFDFYFLEKSTPHQNNSIFIRLVSWWPRGFKKNASRVHL